MVLRTDAWCFQYTPEKSLGEAIEYPMSYVMTNLQRHYNYVFNNLEPYNKNKRVGHMIKLLKTNIPIVLCWTCIVVAGRKIMGRIMLST